MGFASTSEVFGGGEPIFHPGFIYFGESAGSHYRGTMTRTGNKFTWFGRVYLKQFLNATETYRRIFQSNGSHPSIYTYPSDHGSDPNTIIFLVRNSASAIICQLKSTVQFDNELTPLSILFAFDGDAGTARLVINGQEGDDTGWVSRVAPTTGTFLTGAQAHGLFGDYATGARNQGGSGSFFGFTSDYLPDSYYDFFNLDNTPKFQDTDTWASTGFGAQPLLYAPNGDPQDNLGSGGAWTAYNGPKVAYKKTALVYNNKGLATIGDINSNLVPYGKVGWANAQRYAGIHNPIDRGIIADYWVPINSAIATSDWDPSADFEGRLVVCNGLADQATTYSGKDWNRTAAGCAYNANSYAPLVDLRSAPIPARTLNLRRYYFEWMQFSASVASANDGINFIVNFVDNSNFNFVQVILVGSQYQVRYLERVAGADTTRSTITYSSIVDEPCYGWVMFDDWGDTILLSSGGFETDNATGDYSIFRNFYTAVGRPNKAGTGFYIGMGQVTTPSRFGIRGFSVRELG